VKSGGGAGTTGAAPAGAGSELAAVLEALQ
jgi:hypothetical protein